MGDMGEVFNDLKQIKKQKRADNTKSSTEMLVAAGVTFTSHNGGAHLRVVAGDDVVDFWPSTGLWQVSGWSKQNRGVKSLISFVKRNPPAPFTLPLADQAFADELSKVRSPLPLKGERV